MVKFYIHSQFLGGLTQSEPFEYKTIKMLNNFPIEPKGNYGNPPPKIPKIGIAMSTNMLASLQHVFYPSDPGRYDVLAAAEPHQKRHLHKSGLRVRVRDT